MTLRGYPGLSPANTTEGTSEESDHPSSSRMEDGVFSIYTNISTIYRMDDGFIGSCCVLSTLASGPQNQHRMLPPARCLLRSGAVSPQESVPAPVSPVSWCRHTARMPPHHLLLSLPVTLIPHPPLARATVSSSTFTGAPTTQPLLELKL